MVHVPEKPEQNRLKTMKTIDLAGGMLPGARKVGTYRWHTIHRVRELTLGGAEKISNFKHEQIDGICVGVWIFGLNVFSVSLHFRKQHLCTCAGMWFVVCIDMYFFLYGDDFCEMCHLEVSSGGYVPVGRTYTTMEVNKRWVK